VAGVPEHHRRAAADVAGAQGGTLMPALEQLNIRVTPAVKSKFRERALREGLSQAQLLESLLKQRGSLERWQPAPQPTAPQPTAPAPQETEERVHFPTWLQGRVHVPRALAARAVAAGRVLVAGVPYTAEEIPAKLLKTAAVTYEGTDVTRPIAAEH
jgi:hypothetical protein